jgi:prephenate dehydratase
MNAKNNTGYKGSFHHQVAQEYYKQVVVDECLSFEELVVCFQEIRSGSYGNRKLYSGAIIPNYALIDKMTYI